MSNGPKTKAQRKNKIERSQVYVSFEYEKEPRLEVQEEWVKYFVKTLIATCEANDRELVLAREIAPEETGKIAPGDVRPKGKTSEALAEALESASEVIGVLTQTYVNANIDKKGEPSEGELSQFFRVRFEAEKPDHSDKLQIFLAPLIRPNWKSIYVRRITLDDSRLVRLKETRFQFPERDLVGVMIDEVNEAVARVFNTMPVSAPGDETMK